MRPPAAKYQKNLAAVLKFATPETPAKSHTGITAAATALAADCLRNRTFATPNRKKSKTTSDSVQAVTNALIPKTAHKIQSVAIVDFASLQPLRAMMAMTAAPIP
jgi:hypothetical protein